MIQFNLLPDVKIEFIKAQRTKRFVIGISLLTTAASLVIFVMLVLTVNVWQKKTIDDLSKDIKTASNQLQSTQDLNKILTVQSQLGSLSTLHDTKPASSHLFTYLSQLTPTDATISDMTADFTQNTLSITGNAPDLKSANKFTDSLKFTKYTVTGSDEKKNAFTNVVLASYGRTSVGATYTITLNFDAEIFSNTNVTNLVVPNIVTTRSVTEQPSILFEQGSKQE